MNKLTRTLILCLIISSLLSITVWSQNKSDLIEISPVHGEDAKEILTKKQLQRLTGQYDVSKWLFTKKILIDRDVIPHSHPVLTLSTRYLKDDELLLSAFLHEETHWFFEEREEQTKKAIAELKTIFPKVPVGYPEGAQDENSTYLHLLVCYSEYQADKELLGELKAQQIIEFWSKDHYTWVYKQILDEERKIGTVIRKQKLMI
jgi:hypothetical protein